MILGVRINLIFELGSSFIKAKNLYLLKKQTDKQKTKTETETKQLDLQNWEKREKKYVSPLWSFRSWFSRQVNNQSSWDQVYFNIQNCGIRLQCCMENKYLVWYETAVGARNSLWGHLTMCFGSTLMFCVSLLKSQLKFSTVSSLAKTVGSQP